MRDIESLTEIDYPKMLALKVDPSKLRSSNTVTPSKVAQTTKSRKSSPFSVS
jgi:hypothetical protein